MSKFLSVGLAATGIAAAAAAVAGFKAGVAYTNEQLFAEDVALPKKPAKDINALTGLVHEIVKEESRKSSATTDNDLARKVESMTRCLALDQRLAQQIAKEKFEQAERAAEKAREAVAKAIAEQKATIERAQEEADGRQRAGAMWIAKMKDKREAEERKARMTPEERAKQEIEDLEFLIRCKEYGGAPDTFT